MQDLKPIRVFLEVATRRSFAAAARDLRMTPATVTRTVAQLERDLGQQLLVRTTRQVSLTAFGAEVAARYRRIVDDFDRATVDLLRATQPHRGRLRINAPMSFGLRVMPRLIDSFRLAYPRIELEVSLSDTLLDVMESAHDLAIRISLPPRDKSTIWRKLCEIPRVAVASPRLFDRHPRPLSPDDLHPALCLAYASSGEEEVWQFRKGQILRRVTAGRMVVANNGDFLTALVLAGSGIAMLPEFIVHDALASGRAEVILPDWSLPQLWLSLHYPPYQPLPPLVEIFSSFFEAFLRDVEGMDFESNSG